MAENPNNLLKQSLIKLGLSSSGLGSRSNTKHSNFTDDGEGADKELTSASAANVTGLVPKELICAVMKITEIPLLLSAKVRFGMAEQLTQDEIAEIQEVFSMFDKDGDGSISAKEVGAVLRSVGFNPAEAEITKLLTDFEMDENTGAVDFSDFLGMMTRMERSGDTEEEVEEAFRVFDKEGNGIISAPDLRLIMTTMGEKLSEDQVEEMIQFADCEAQGEINYKELIKSLLCE